jgi:hypothetical protein
MDEDAIPQRRENGCESAVRTAIRDPAWLDRTAREIPQKEE